MSEQTVKKAKKLSKRIIALIVAGAILAALGLTLLGFCIGFWAVDANCYIWRPDYEMLTQEELRQLYEKPDPTDDDYRILFEQTGLTRIGIQRAKQQAGGFGRVLAVQQSYFKERGIMHYHLPPLMCTDYLTGDASVNGYLERGDIIISSSTHFSGFKIGHSAVITTDYGNLFQSNSVGAKNGYSTFSAMFSTRLNFMVLRINPAFFSQSGLDDGEYRNNLNRAVSYIEQELAEVPYNPCTGIFTKKDGLAATTCAHMIWYGFKHFDDGNGGRFNIDLDSNGGLLVVPKDFSLSPYVEIVQVFGFDPSVMYD